MDSTQSESLIGQVLEGRYEIRRLIGSGGMGEVYLAQQLTIDMPRAVKVLREQDEGSEDAEQRFRREALAMSRLQHDKIAQVIDFGALLGGGHFLVMEYVEGPSLQQRVLESGGLGLADALRVATQLADALAYAHERGVVHRDLKPANGLLRDGRVDRLKVIDFGLARLLSAEGLTRLTTRAQILGTPLFMAPEQCRGEAVQPAADVYALAGVVYYLVTGKPVFQARSLAAIVFAQATEAPRPLSAHAPGLAVPPALDELLLACLAKAPADRPSALEVLEACERLVGVVGNEVLALGRTLDELPPTNSLLDRPEVLASQIWLDRPSRRESPGLSSQARRREALFNQTTAVLMEIAQVLELQFGLTETLGRQVGRIREIQETIVDVEMEVALLDDRLAELGAPSASDSASLREERESLLSRSAEHARLLNREYRNLYKVVLNYRRQAVQPGLQRLYRELEEIIEEYLTLAAQGGAVP